MIQSIDHERLSSKQRMIAERFGGLNGFGEPRSQSDPEKARN
jgi:hypothetical protein